MTEILKGAAVAAAITEKLASRAEALKERGIVPTLAVIRIGENESDLSYERGLDKRCEKVGIEVKKILLPEDASVEMLLEQIDKVNSDHSVHGCLMFRPLKDKNAEQAAAERLCPSKDVDSMTPSSLSSVFMGGSGFPPCTPEACIEILKFYGIEMAGKRVAVIGRSNVIGKPVAMLLLAENATVTVCHSKSENLADICRESDIIICAVGRAKMVGPEFFRPGQTVIDVGINVDADGKLCGDADFDAAQDIVSAITPVPGGVGAVTTSILAKHVIEAAEKADEN